MAAIAARGDAANIRDGRQYEFFGLGSGRGRRASRLDATGTSRCQPGSHRPAPGSTSILHVRAQHRWRCPPAWEYVSRLINRRTVAAIVDARACGRGARYGGFEPDSARCLASLVKRGTGRTRTLAASTTGTASASSPSSACSAADAACHDAWPSLVFREWSAARATRLVPGVSVPACTGTDAAATPTDPAATIYLPGSRAIRAGFDRPAIAAPLAGRSARRASRWRQPARFLAARYERTTALAG